MTTRKEKIAEEILIDPELYVEALRAHYETLAIDCDDMGSPDGDLSRVAMLLGIANELLEGRGEK